MLTNRHEIICIYSAEWFCHLFGDLHVFSGCLSQCHYLHDWAFSYRSPVFSSCILDWHSVAPFCPSLSTIFLTNYPFSLSPTPAVYFVFFIFPWVWYCWYKWEATDSKTKEEWIISPSTIGILPFIQWVRCELNLFSQRECRVLPGCLAFLLKAEIL